MKIIKKILRYLLYAVPSMLLALAIRLFLFNFYVVPSYSMEPTNVILSEKWTYGTRIFTGLKFDRNKDPQMTFAGIPLYPKKRCLGIQFSILASCQSRDEKPNIGLNYNTLHQKPACGYCFYNQRFIFLYNFLR